MAYCNWTVSATFTALATPVFAQAGFFKGRLISVDIVANVGAALTFMIALYPHVNVAPGLVRDVTTAMISSVKELVSLEALYGCLPELNTYGIKAFEFGGVVLHDGAVAAYRNAGLLA